MFSFAASHRAAAIVVAVALAAATGLATLLWPAYGQAMEVACEKPRPFVRTTVCIDSGQGILDDVGGGNLHVNGTIGADEVKIFRPKRAARPYRDPSAPDWADPDDRVLIAAPVGTQMDAITTTSALPSGSPSSEADRGYYCRHPRRPGQRQDGLRATWAVSCPGARVDVNTHGADDRIRFYLSADDLATEDNVYPWHVSVNAGAGNDLVVGSSGNRSLSRSAALIGDEIFGGVGDDRLFGVGGRDAIFGSDPSLPDPTGLDDDTIYGGPGPDVLLGDEGEDWIYGGDDDDTVRDDHRRLLDGHWRPASIPPANDVVIGGRGEDRLEFSAGVDLAYAAEPELRQTTVDWTTGRITIGAVALGAPAQHDTVDCYFAAPPDPDKPFPVKVVHRLDWQDALEPSCRDEIRSEDGSQPPPSR